MRRLDFFLLDHLYQPICDRLYDRIGDCAIIARACIIVTVGLTILYGGWRVNGLLLLHRPYAELIIVVLAQLCMVIGVALYAQVIGRMVGRTGANPLRFILSGPRIMFTLWLTFLWCLVIANNDLDLIGDILGIMRDVMLVSVVYFLSCQNRPPLKRYYRQWAEA